MPTYTDVATLVTEPLATFPATASVKKFAPPTSGKLFTAATTEKSEPLLPARSTADVIKARPYLRGETEEDFEGGGSGGGD